MNARAVVEAAITAIRSTMSRQCSDLSAEEYMQVLEEIGADVEGAIDALKEENPGMFV